MASKSYDKYRIVDYVDGHPVKTALAGVATYLTWGGLGSTWFASMFNGKTNSSDRVAGLGCGVLIATIIVGEFTQRVAELRRKRNDEILDGDVQ
ncbi:MAG: hypothetical protein LBM73_00380 [Candidatus Nomurabacteria bacterium]|jgi:hypothetical protein|nr:hypothetical protein [Candidatus Nomurabacteria bacterium]